MNITHHAAAALLLGFAGMAGADGEPGADLAARLDAGTVAAISDGDFRAETYATGQLAPPEAGHRDILTVLTKRDGRVERAQIEVSNSVTAPPEVLKLAPDGKTAFVIERLGPRPPGATHLRELPPGRRLAAIDLRDPRAPRLAGSAELAAFPEALAVSPDGAWIATVSNTPEASVLQLVRYADGRFSSVQTLGLAGLGINGSVAGQPRSGVTASNVQWHPSGRALAININTLDRVDFLRVEPAADGTLQVQRWGAPVAVGKDPFVGRFTPDGRHYLTSDWGRDFAAKSLDERLPKTASTLSVIRLAPAGGDPAAARHERVAGATSDLSAEGLAVSPDGRLVATVNMRGTVLPAANPRFQREASVSLLRFDAASGTLTKLADHAFVGVLPEGASFDASGKHLLVSVFQAHADARPGEPAGAGLDVWRIVEGSQPRLERLGRIPMPHGVHHVDVAR